MQLSARFQEFTIADMAEAQVAQFLRRWCRAIEEAQQPEASEAQWERQAEAEAGAILQAIGSSEGVKRLTVNPLLLTILALIHRNGSRLPERRVDLYKLAVKTLTEDWQLGKKLPDAPKLVVKEQEAMELLAPLAYWMHEEKPSGVLTHAEVIQQLSPKLAELRGELPDAPVVQQAVESFLRRVRETTGLFVERAPGVYGFMHLTFEEYFAARYIADNELRDMLALIQEHWHEPRWEEPILLALAYLGSHSPNQLNRLVEQLFADLDQYQPIVSQGDIRIKCHSAQNNILSFPVWNGESKVSYKESEATLQPLLLAGKVLSQVELNSKIRVKLIEKLILTYIGLPELCFNEVENKVEGQILALLRQIESFKQAEEIRDCLAKFSDDRSIPAWKKMKIQLAKLHLTCDMRGQELVDYVTELISQLDPFWFGFFMRTCEDGNWGTEMSQALELIQDKDIEQSNSPSLDLIKALSYLRKKHIDKAITLLEDLCKQEHHLGALITWAQAVCYRGKDDEPRAIKCYQESFEQLKYYSDQNALCCFWQWWATSYSSIGKYEEALKCMQHGLSHAQSMGWGNGYLFLKKEIAKIYQNLKDYELAVENFQTVRNLYGEIGCDLLIAESESNLGKALQAQGKYEEAIAHYEQSRDLYQQLEKETNVANQWYWMASCYREWGKCGLALEAQQQDLAIRQKLDDQSRIAFAYFQLGHIYQAWGKYEAAIAHHEQSRNRYQQLEKETNVANQWSWMADCYREWGKYELALEAQQQDLAIRQKRDDQPNIAFAYFQLGHIYQAWGKYEAAIAHYQQSRDLYQQLEKETDVADLWYWMAGCYCEWDKYGLALEAQQQDLAIRQKRDDQPNIAFAYFQLGHIYQAWGKYEAAIAHYQQSRDRYQQLEKETDVANQWSWMAACYREWGKYGLALEAEQQDLAIRQKLDDQSRIALAYFQFGRIYQAWGKYEEAIAHFQQSRDRYQQLEKETDVADLWYWMAACYREWGKYGLALEAEQQDLAIRQKLDDQPNIADAYRQLGRIYQAWGKYEEAITHYQQSRDRYKTLDLQQDVANLLSWLASCYRESKDYATAIDYYQHSIERHQAVGNNESVAKRFRQLSNTQRLLAKNCSSDKAIALLEQAKHNLQQAIDLDTAGDYRENLAYDQISLALLTAEHLRCLPETEVGISEQITHFEQSYTRGFAQFTQLGQVVDSAEEALEIARAYLEITALEDLDQAEALARQSLQTFQAFNRRKLEAAADKLLGEIYLKRAASGQAEAAISAKQFLSESLQLYRELTLTQQAEEVAQLLDS